MEANQRGSDEINWKLSGIRVERANLSERLKFLEAEEQRLTGEGMTGTHKPAKTNKARTAKAPVRKRVLTEETREKMRQAAYKRWGKGPTQAAPEPAPEPTQASV